MQQSDTIAYFRAVNGRSKRFTGDVNTLLENCVYWCEAATNTPTTYGTLITIITDTNTSYGSQTFVDVQNGATYVRKRWAATWGTWQKLAVETPSTVENITSTYFSNVSSGNIYLIRQGKIRILTFDLAKVGSLGYFAQSRPFDAGDRPIYVTFGNIDRTDNYTCWSLWVRADGTIGQANYAMNVGVYGQVVWVTA